MKLYFFFFVILLTSLSITAQRKSNGTIDTDGYWVGYANKKTFNQENYRDWFYDYYDRYKTEKNVINQLKKVAKDVQITGYMATWCWESKRDVPRLYKVLEEIGYNFDQLELISVDRSRIATVGSEKGKRITSVPEFIFTRDGKELGRLTKYPMGNIEKYILKTIIGEPFQKQKKGIIKRL